MVITNEAVVMYGELIYFKFKNSDSLVDGPAEAIYKLYDNFYKVHIMIEDVNHPIRAYAHWADDLAEKTIWE